MALCESIIRPFLNLGRNGLRDALSHTNTSSNLSNCSSCWFRITIYLIKVIKKAKLHWQWFLQSLSSCILCWYSWRTEDDIYSISRKLFAFLFSDKIPWMCVRNVPVQRCLVVCGVKVTSAHFWMNCFQSCSQALKEGIISLGISSLLMWRLKREE